MVTLQAAAADLSRYEDLLQRFHREYEEIKGHGLDLLHHQQELQRHAEYLLRLYEDSKRHAQSVRRLSEDNQNHAARLRSMEGMVRNLFSNSLNSMKQTLQSSSSLRMGIEKPQPAAVVVEVNSGKSSETEEDDDDKEEDGGGLDSYAAKSLIDLAGKENSGREIVCSGNVEKDRDKEIMEEVLRGREMITEGERGANLDLGCRFNPTDQELIACLERKVLGESTPGYIKEKNLYGDEEPEDLFRSNSVGELYFFTLIKKKYDQGRKIDRVVGKGTWKIQSTKDVHEDPQNKSSRIIGFKRTLNFVEDLACQMKKSKNSWIMHEYLLNAAPLVNDEQGKWAICRIKRGRGNRIGLQPTSSFSPMNISLKRPVEGDAAHESHMPHPKVAKTSNVLLLTSATASILEPVQRANTVTVVTANVEAPQQDHGQDQRLQSSQYQPTPDNNEQPWIKFL